MERRIVVDEGVVLDELTAGFHLVPHQAGEHLLGFLGAGPVVDRHVVAATGQRQRPRPEGDDPELDGLVEVGVQAQ